MTTRRSAAALAALTVAALTATASPAPASVPASVRAGDGAVRIHDVQGSTRLSPLAGRTVADVPGVVTGVRAYGSRGFWMQDPHPDGSDATSEGVFVYTGSAPTVAVGDEVRVGGQVGEYGDADGPGQTVTQISRPQVEVVASGRPPPCASPRAACPTPTPRPATRPPAAASTRSRCGPAATPSTGTSRWRA